MALLLPWDCGIDHPTPLSNSFAGLYSDVNPWDITGLLARIISEQFFDDSPAYSHWITTGLDISKQEIITPIKPCKFSIHIGEKNRKM